MRNLDIAALRAGVAIVEHGGVSNAATRLNLTQSAVSMQIKRLEDMLGVPIFRREARKMLLTPEGEQFIRYARKMVDMNDELWTRMTAEDYEGKLLFGLPVDIVEPYAVEILSEFAAKYPRVELRLESGKSNELLAGFRAGKYDLIVTTEADGSGFEMVRKPLRWTHALSSQVIYQRPLPIASSNLCSFYRHATEALDQAGIKWRRYAGIDSWQSMKAMVTADLAVHVQIEEPSQSRTRVYHDGSVLPALPDFGIYLYTASGENRGLVDALAEIVVKTYSW